MKEFGIFYGSNTGVTAEVAAEIAKKLGVETSDVHDVAKTSPDAVGNYRTLVLGSSTWGVGELQDDWYDFIDGLEILDLNDKKIALFGCGDETMTDTFCAAVGELYRRLKGTGAKFIGEYPADVYDFNESPAFVDGVYVGLLLDNINKEELSADRIAGWIEQIKKQSAK
ncbi:MAG: flavodoxin [Muribaculum sp.]|nr:flavodoxin [Muribaculaceae bacterium]MCM1081276.1 flavodoxin [Muribaculum sp.]